MTLRAAWSPEAFAPSLPGCRCRWRHRAGPRGRCRGLARHRARPLRHQLQRLQRRHLRVPVAGRERELHAGRQRPPVRAARRLHLERRDPQLRPDRQPGAEARLLHFRLQEQPAGRLDQARLCRRRRHQHRAPAAGAAQARHHPAARAASQGRHRPAQRHHGAVARLDRQSLRPPDSDLRRQGAFRSGVQLQGRHEGRRAGAERATRHRPRLPRASTCRSPATRSTAIRASWPPTTRSR